MGSVILDSCRDKYVCSSLPLMFASYDVHGCQLHFQQEKGCIGSKKLLKSWLRTVPTMALPWIRKRASLLKSYSSSSSSGEADFMNLCQQNVRSIQALVKGGSLLNERQCRDLSLKLLKTVDNIQSLVFTSWGSTNLFRPALEDFYRILEKAKLLVNKCCKDDWITEAVFQIENAKDFQVILLEVGLCYHSIYEQAKDVSEPRDLQQLEDLRNTSTFRPAAIDVVHNDQEALKRRLEGLVSSPKKGRKQSNRYVQHYLARYLLETWGCMSQLQSQIDELDLSSIISCMEEIESTETWGKGSYLGGGSSGGVCSCTWLGIPCAKKFFHGDPKRTIFLKEAGVLYHLNHPNIVKFFCCGYGQEEGDCYIAMELLDMSLAKLISKRAHKKTAFSNTAAVGIIVQIARAMCYLHGMGVAHRDLKPHNVVVIKLTSPHLVDQYCVKVVDFGLAKVKIEASKSNNMSCLGIGTTRYRAPEGHPDGPGKVNWFKADVYSFASTCAHLLSLKEPFENINLGNKYVELMNGLRPELPATCPGKLVALLNDCWNIRPHLRPSFMEICVKLEEVRHELLKGSSSPNPDFKQEVRLDSKSYEFIQIVVEEQMQHIASTVEVIESNQTSDSVIASDMETSKERVREHLGTIMSDSSSAMDVSSSLIMKVTNKGEHASTSDTWSAYQAAHMEAIMQNISNFSMGDEPDEFSKPYWSEMSSHEVKRKALQESVLGKTVSEQSGPLKSIDFSSELRNFNLTKSFTSNEASTQALLPVCKFQGNYSSPKQAALEKLGSYLKLGGECLEAVQKMSNSRKFNNEQCGYLEEKLKLVVQSASLFLQVARVDCHVPCSSLNNARLVEFFEFLVALSKQSESFVEDCCKDAWVQAAMTLSSMSEYVSSLGFNLELCHVALSKECAETACLTLVEVGDIDKAEKEIVKMKASLDVVALRQKVALELNSLDGENRDLAIYLLQILLGVKPNLIRDDGRNFDKLSDLVTSEEELGRGASGTVLKIRWLGMPVAKKRFNGANNRDFLKEVDILSQLCHSNITSMFCSAQSNQNCSIIMELMDGNLHELMERRRKEKYDSQPFANLEAVNIMLQIGEGMNYMQTNGYVHRDLKSMNILVRKVSTKKFEDIGYVHVKLADFGLSMIEENYPTYSNVGTRRWMAPEFLSPHGGKTWLFKSEKLPKYPFKGDIYSFGMVCYEILSGCIPFSNICNANDIRKKVMMHQRPLLPSGCPPRLKTLIEKCWSQNPEERPTFCAICSELKYIKYMLMIGTA